jgi:hypothetical protein
MIRRFVIAALCTAVILAAVSAGPFDPHGLDNPVYARRVLAPSICEGLAALGVEYRAAWYVVSGVALFAGLALVAELGVVAPLLIALSFLVRRLQPLAWIVDGDGVVNPEDLLAIAGACCLIWAANGRHWLWWYLALGIGVLNRESAVLFAPLALVLDCRHGIVSTLFGAVAIAALHVLFPAEASDAFAHNIGVVMSYGGIPLAALALMAVLAGAIPLAIPRTPLQRGLIYVAALSIVATFAHGHVVEWRVWGEVSVCCAALTASAWGVPSSVILHPSPFRSEASHA